MKNNRRIFTLLLLAALLLCCLQGVSAENADAPLTTAANPNSTRDPYETLTGKSATEIVSMMGLGFNIGNTFDSTGGDLKTHETKWGNPVVTQALIDTIYDNGFDTVRIPITWMDFISKDGTYTVDPAYLARVKEVVDYCYNDGLFVIINAHHESWINIPTLDQDYKKVGEELQALWAQIATYFADYDQHLIFEGMNEPRMAGTSIEWTGNSDAYYAVNYLNQVFANTIRSNGLGHNDERCLMVTGYAAQSSSNIMKSITLPTYKGKTVNNLIISLHSYTPYEFCLTDKKKTFSLTSSSDIGNVKAVFRDIHDTFLRYGIPVIMGETGATNSGNNKDARVNWAYYTSKMAAYYGIPIILWDNGAGGSSGGECHQYINRKANNSITFPEFFEALHRGQEEATRGGYVNLTDSPFPVNAATDGRAAFTSLKPYKTSLTPAALPVIEPRDTRPTPTPSPTPTPTETPTVTPTAAPTEAAPTESAVTVTPTPGAATDGESSTNMLVVIGAILGLIGCAFIVGFGFYLIFRGFKKR